MKVVEEQKCKKCGCTDANACVGPERPCYWAEPDLCSHCKEFTFHTFTPKLKHPNSKEIKHMIKKSYSKTELDMNDTEHDILYNDLMIKWKHNTWKNRNRFIQELMKNQSSS